ncbi:MAG TPA: HIT family protein [Wenzhouxiangellaceae bacterium]|nr:HIT family protein [Wenzhouxiangellaceae bacterium]
MQFELDPVLAGDTFEVASFDLCEVRLMNDARFPWLILVPRREAAVEILDLEPADQDQLWKEIRAAAESLRRTCRPDKLNIAALGNQVAQLHVHVVARFRSDEAWPAPVWGSGRPRRYSRQDGDDILNALESTLTPAGQASE